MDKGLANLKLLLVDNEDDFRRATSRTLNRRGFTVTEAADGEEALTAIRRECPDIVVLDLKMPGMSGIETLQGVCRSFGSSRSVEEAKRDRFKGLHM